MTNRKKLKLPNSVMEYADIDYLDKLSEEDRQYMMEFIDGYYNNNFRKYSIFTDSEHHEDMKKEIYDMTNARNRCGQSANKAKGTLVEIDRMLGIDSNLRMEDILRSNASSKNDGDILKLLGVTGFKEGVEKIIDSTLHELSDYSKDHSIIMLRFYVKMVKLVKYQRKLDLNDRKIAREREERDTP